MRELVPLTNAVAARMIISALSGCGGDRALLACVRAPVPTAAGAATESGAVKTQAAPAVKSAADAKAVSRANDPSRKHHSTRWLLTAV
jgi:hypothetical protein